MSKRGARTNPQRNNAPNAAPQTNVENMPAPALGVTSPSVNAANDDAQFNAEIKKRFPFALFFRTSFHESLTKANADNSWQIPEKNDFINQKENNPFSFKKGKDGCNFHLKNETAKFQLINNNDNSHAALGRCIAAYVETYDKWREQCKKQDEKALDLIFELTVYDEAQIKPILAALEAVGQTLHKVKLVDQNNQARELSAQEIAMHSTKPRTTALAQV